MTGRTSRHAPDRRCARRSRSDARDGAVHTLHATATTRTHTHTHASPVLFDLTDRQTVNIRFPFLLAELTGWFLTGASCVRGTSPDGRKLHWILDGESERLGKNYDGFNKRIPYRSRKLGWPFVDLSSFFVVPARWRFPLVATIVFGRRKLRQI